MSMGQIFDYVTTSNYFHPDIYLLHNRAHKARTRDRKRKNYTDFLVYCERLDYMPINNKETFRAVMLEKAFAEFDGFKAKYDEAMKQYEIKK